MTTPPAPALITIGITCYNAAATIGRAIDSALAQDWPATEIIVVDDASTDGSVRIVQGYGGRVRLIVNDANLGVAGATNRIIAAAKGEFIALFDDDDESLPGRLTAQAAAIEGYEAATGARLVACFAGGSRRYANGYAVELRPPGLGSLVPQGDVMAEYLLYFQRRRGVAYGGTPACSLMARRDTFAALGGFDPALRRVQDIDFCVRLAIAGGHFIGCAGDLVRQYATGGGDKSPQAEYAAWRALLAKHAPYLRQRRVYAHALRWASFRYLYFDRRWGRAAAAFAGIVLRHPVRGLRQLAATGGARFWHDRRQRA